MKTSVIFLGTGTSVGVPVIGCSCKTCISDNPRNRRYRSSLVVRLDGCTVVVDTAPEFRLQILERNIIRLDAVFFTHHHADHILGLDDVRRFNEMQHKRIVCYGNKRTIDEVRTIFDYAFKKDTGGHTFPKIELRVVEAGVVVDGIPVIPLTVYHGSLPILGYRIHDCAYVTDCSLIPDESFAALKGVKTLIIGALRKKEYPTHFNVSQALEAARQIGAERTYLTHLSHDLEYESISRELPEGTRLAYDGLEIETV